MISRRRLLQFAGLGAVAGATGSFRRARARETPDVARPADAETRAGGAYTPVITPNGWTLPYRVKGGWKEFHLIAEEIEHEFAPGCRATCWGYNGTTPGPTIEAVQGDKVRVYVTNRLPEHTSIHWHGILLASGMDGVGGLSQPHIEPGETFVYEFELDQHGTHMYHPHADEMVQQAFGLMGMLVIHSRNGEELPIDRDYCILLHNWALHPGTWRPDPAVMLEFDLWTFNSRVYPGIEPLLAETGDRVRIRMGNLSMWNHPLHIHGHKYWVTGSDGGRWPRSLWRPETSDLVGVGQTRDFEFDAVAGDWAFHCHMAHHVMNPMGHDIPNTVGVDQSGVADRLRRHLPGYMPMGRDGMAEHQEHTDAGHMKGPDNTLPMMAGKGPYGNIEMGGMFTIIKIRDRLPARGEPGWYDSPDGTVAYRVSTDPDFGDPPRRG